MVENEILDSEVRDCTLKLVGQILKLYLLAVTTPRGVELDEDVLVGVKDEFLEISVSFKP